MNILDLVKTTEAKAPRLTIYGKPGIGKSTFAATFPKALFILPEENGLTGINALGPVKTFTELWEIIKDLLQLETIPYETIVIDSISKVDQLVVEHILQREKEGAKKRAVLSLASACGGYGAGYSAAQQMHRALKSMLDRLQERNITVIYVGHLVTIKHKSPDAEDYDIYSIVMNHDKSREVYIDDVDGVLFCRLKSFTSETDSGRIIVNSTHDRIMIGTLSESHVSKNRYDLPDELPMDFKSLKDHIPFYKEKQDDK